MIQNPQPTQLLYLEYSPACCKFYYYIVFSLLLLETYFLMDANVELL